MRTTSPTPAVGARADGAPATANGAGAGYLLLFVAAAYALAWLPFAVPILAARGVLARPAPDVVFITLATLGVCLAGVGAAAAESGRAGVRALLAGVPRWRVRPAWYAAAVLVPALFPAGGFLLGLALGEPVPPAPPPGVWLSLPLLLVALTVPALLEEIGWRGYALPRLQGRLGPLPAALVLGVVWAGMHLPLWLLPDFGFAGQSVPLYVVQVTAISVVLAWLYNGTGGSLLLTGLAHAAVNGWPQPWAAALPALPEEARATALSDFQALITAATVAIAAAVVLAARRRARTGGSRRPVDGRREGAELAGTGSSVPRCPPATIAQLLAAIRAGGLPHVAAQAYGLRRSTWFAWMQLGRRGRAPCAALYEQVEQACAGARAVAEIEVKRTDPKYWLSRGPGRDRGDPDDPGWTNVNRVEATGKDGRALISIEALRLITERVDGREDEADESAYRGDETA